MGSDSSSAGYDRVVERRRAVALARDYREVEGLSVAQIARRLGRSPATIKAYFYDPCHANKRPTDNPRALTQASARRAPHTVSSRAQGRPGCLSTAELSLPSPGATALRPIPAGARPYAGGAARASTGRGTPVWHAQPDSAARRLASIEAPRRALDLRDRAGLDSRRKDGAGVRDEDVDLASLRDGAIDAGLVGHVQAQSLVHRAVSQAVRIPCSGDDPVAAPSDLDGGGSADPLGGAGNQDRGVGA